MLNLSIIGEKNHKNCANEDQSLVLSVLTDDQITITLVNEISIDPIAQFVQLW